MAKESLIYNCQARDIDDKQITSADDLSSKTQALCTHVAIFRKSYEKGLITKEHIVMHTQSNCDWIWKTDHLRTRTEIHLWPVQPTRQAKTAVGSGVVPHAVLLMVKCTLVV